MANKRKLKKEIRYICGDLALETILTAEYIPGANISKLNELVAKIAALQEQALSLTSFTYDKSARDFENRAAYRKALAAYHTSAYHKFRDNFNNQIKEIVKELNAAIPQQQREKCKELSK